MKKIFDLLLPRQFLCAMTAAMMLSGCLWNNYGALNLQDIPHGILRTGFYEICTVPKLNALDCDGKDAWYVADDGNKEFLLQLDPDISKEKTIFKIRFNKTNYEALIMQTSWESNSGVAFAYTIAIPSNDGIFIWQPTRCDTNMSVVQEWAKKNNLSIDKSGCYFPGATKIALSELLMTLMQVEISQGEFKNVSFFKPVSEARGMSIWAAAGQKK